MSSTEVNWIHILLIAPAIGYASWLNYKGEPLPPSMAIVGMVVALIVVLFHVFRLWQKRTPETAVNVDVIEVNGQQNGDSQTTQANANAPAAPSANNTASQAAPAQNRSQAAY